MICMNRLKLYKSVFKIYELYWILALVFFDYISKYLFVNFLSIQKINLIWDYVFLEIYKNTGIAFSIQFPFLKIMTILIIIGIIYYYIKIERIKNNKYLNFSFIFIISWALWNARERILLWQVTDFIWIKYFSIFNFADIYINIWIIIYLIIIFLKKDKVWI
jgi:signal peptidase II